MLGGGDMTEEVEKFIKLLGEYNFEEYSCSDDDDEITYMYANY